MLHLHVPLEKEEGKEKKRSEKELLSLFTISDECAH